MLYKEPKVKDLKNTGQRLENNKKTKPKTHYTFCQKIAI